jgi:hypothetical protein
MRPFLVSLGIVLALGAAVVRRALASDNHSLASVASAVVSASRIEAWRLSCRDTTNPKVLIEGVAIDVGQAADLDSIRSCGDHARMHRLVRYSRLRSALERELVRVCP